MQIIRYSFSQLIHLNKPTFIMLAAANLCYGINEDKLLPPLTFSQPKVKQSPQRRKTEGYQYSYQPIISRLLEDPTQTIESLLTTTAT